MSDLRHCPRCGSAGQKAKGTYADFVITCQVCGNKQVIHLALTAKGKAVLEDLEKAERERGVAPDA